MKNILITILIILTILNLTFLTEISKNEDLNNFYYNNQELSEDYSNKEKTHMQDVKDLINTSITINALLFLTFLIKKTTNYKKVGKYLIITSLFLYVAAIFFQQFFHNFHLLFFNNNNWLLPSTSKLIQTYPLTYFRNIFLIINTIYLILGAFLNKLRLSNLC
ncbi:DUF1461 domain-containing protein [Candidatus Woesearchaeota archaeon]|jgi:integral membrane protein (TIGR01906 family)|nr:DUF1461 domain-containing protein [Candidatus Woesearchaeota archaeon]MBT7237554.1 DUF1461 domain-containing protein [Candidatus Woesearchaeota archaeon]